MALLMAALIAVPASVASTGPAAAHEFWISPDAYQVAPGEAIVAALRNGERFSGRSLAHRPSRTERFELVQGSSEVALEPTIGDRPAIDAAAPGEGLVVLVHETGDLSLDYDDLARFEAFGAHKGYPGLAEAHEARGLGMPVRERYRRHAKSLVAVGEGSGADAPVGLRAELIALANPYEGPLEALPVELRWEGAALRDHQIEVFARGEDGEVAITTHRTDASGRASVPVSPGTEVMIDAVVIEPLEREDEDDPAWASHWANLTFAVPS